MNREPFECQECGGNGVLVKEVPGYDHMGDVGFYDCPYCTENHTKYDWPDTPSFKRQA